MPTELVRRTFTVGEYQNMAAAGILGEDDRVELLAGEVVEMSPIGKRHVACVNRLTGLLSAQVMPGQGIVSVQNPIHLTDYSQPQPDIVLLRWRDDYYEDMLPAVADVLLLIEVAESSLATDRSVKLPRYAVMENGSLRAAK